MAKDLLLEIGTEEIPAKFMPGALEQLEQLAKTKFDEQRIAYSELRAVGTPRRLTLVVKGVDEQQADKSSENKGPSVKVAFDEAGNPSKAAQGFARGQGVDVSQLVVKEGYVYALVHEKGRPVVELLPVLLPEIITGLNFPKSMRWGDLDIRFARPVHWLVALFGGDVVPFTFAEVESGNKTRGHRFLGKVDITVTSPDDYFAKMAENYVMVDQDVRRSTIREQVENIAVKHGGTASIDEELLEEVVYLVEYPTALCGSFEAEYLALPAEAIITPMREHQRYFPVMDKNGKLMPLFITVRNGGSEHIDIVSRGNQRVLRARLADAKFFFEEDKKIPLAERTEKLKTIVYQEGLGTLYDKTMRIKQLSGIIAKAAGVDDDLLPVIERGAFLAKADLVTGMVYEFTELQGVMGREYALLNGESPAVADAIFEHYLPRFSGDILPGSPAGRIISMADKIDNIAATFSRGLIPTGSQDPYALRRQALGIVNILIDAQYHVSVTMMVSNAMDLLGITDADRRGKLVADVEDFFRLRLKNILSDSGIRYDIVDAVLAVGIDDVYDVCLRAQAMAQQVDNESMVKVVQAFARVGNLAKNAAVETIDAGLFTTDAEKDLFKAYETARVAVENMVSDRNYTGVLAQMAGLVKPIDAFFEAVMVMVDDMAVRNNRLALLKGITGLAVRVADLSKVVVS